jgi:hypothetical protein
VYEVMEYLASEMTEAEILDDFPDLTREDLKAGIGYVANRERRFTEAIFLTNYDRMPQWCDRRTEANVVIFSCN